MNLDIISVILLSIIQGFLEWWPVSSQGQLTIIVLQGIADPMDALSIALVFHVGTMFVVLAIFRDKFVSLIRPPVDRWLWKYLLLTTVGTALTGIPLLLFIGDIFTQVNATILSVCIGVLLLITGSILWYTKKTTRLQEPRGLKSLSVLEILLFGCIQGIAILPGVSRSGLTITYLLIRQVNKDEAMVGSFLVSVPAILGGFTLDIIRGGFQSLITSVPLNLIFLSIIVTFFIGIASINALLRLTEKIDFSILCWILGIVIISYETVGWILLNLL